MYGMVRGFKYLTMPIHILNIMSCIRFLGSQCMTYDVISDALLVQYLLILSTDIEYQFQYYESSVYSNNVNLGLKDLFNKIWLIKNILNKIEEEYYVTSI